MLKKLSLLTLVALMGIVASGTTAWGGDIITIISPPKGANLDKTHFKAMVVRYTISGFIQKEKKGCIEMVVRPTVKALSSDYYLLDVWSTGASNRQEFTFYKEENISIGIPLPRFSGTNTSQPISVRLYLYRYHTANNQYEYIANKSTNLNVKYEPVTVWPGDCNNDGVVNMSDVLPVGQYWDYAGPPSFTQASRWEAKTAAVWANPKAAYADANGDGVIDSKEVLVIGHHYRKTHN